MPSLREAMEIRGHLLAFLLRRNAAAKSPAPTRAYVTRIGVILGKPGDGALIDAVKLTQPDGATVLIDPLAVSAIRAPVAGEYAEGVQTVLTMGRRSQGVQEPVAKVAAAVRVRGGKV